MKAIVYSEHGGPEVLRYMDVAKPQIDAYEVLVRVRASALNHLDLWIRAGLPSAKIKAPFILGCDVNQLMPDLAHATSNGTRGIAPSTATMFTADVPPSHTRQAKVASSTIATRRRPTSPISRSCRRKCHSAMS